LAADDRYRRQLAQRVVGQLRDQRRVDREADVVDQHGMAVGRRLGRHVGTDGAASTAAVVDHHRLLQPFGEFLGDDAADDVVAAARRERHDEADRAIGIPLRKNGNRRSG
jgi:hypothetical protein